MLLNLTQQQAVALGRELERALSTDPDVLAVRDKLARGLGPTTSDPIPGQTTIDDHLEAA